MRVLRSDNKGQKGGRGGEGGGGEKEEKTTAVKAPFNSFVANHGYRF